MANIKQIKIGSTSYDLASTYDKNGNDITSTYLKLSGGGLTGHLTLTESKSLILKASSGVNPGSIIFKDNANTEIGRLWLSSNKLVFRAGDSSATSNTVLHSGNYTSYTVTKTGSGASGSWGISVTGSSGSCTGNAATATALTSNAGNSTTPVYFTGGKPEACSRSIPVVYTAAECTTYTSDSGTCTPAAVKKAVGLFEPKSHTHSAATTSANGFMSSAMVTKLNGIATGANNYTHPSSHAATMITQDSTHRFVTDTEKSTWNGKQNALGFTPVQQGGGTGQSTNKIYIGWSGTKLKCQVDKTNLGNIMFEGTQDSEISTTSANGFRIKYGSYGFFIRNDGSNTYFMLTNSNDTGGNWSDARPFVLNHSTGNVSLANDGVIARRTAPFAMLKTPSNPQSAAANCWLGSDGGVYKTSNSSRKNKKDIDFLKEESISPDILYNIPIRQFKYKELIEGDCRKDKLIPGFIVEELDEIYPIIVDKNTEDSKEWNWNEKYLIPPMLKLIQDQKKEIDNLSFEVEELKRIIFKEEDK